MLLFRETLNPC
uniref:Uncharacterized protein n=1 Tax=Anguilla anguilla TaxID=7936 RepID=A0A0E9V2Y7_ANGAN